MAVYVLAVVGCLLLLLVVLRARRRRTAAPVAVSSRRPVPTEDELRRRLLTRLAVDMRVPAARAARAMSALRDMTPEPAPAPVAATTRPDDEGEEISWAP
ncbi:hypothetical protein [Mycobacteroides saopaulense]|uniref:hypothetical protein n=1 Tax=Mycobacteroides saopaulense TaxID=1578165 RepID=UPI001041D21D|nr:hypothetical protein [Mycobacteroides saopaulense]